MISIQAKVSLCYMKINWMMISCSRLKTLRFNCKSASIFKKHVDKNVLISSRFLWIPIKVTAGKMIAIGDCRSFHKLITWFLIAKYYCFLSDTFNTWEFVSCVVPEELLNRSKTTTLLMGVCKIKFWWIIWIQLLDSSQSVCQRRLKSVPVGIHSVRWNIHCEIIEYLHHWSVVQRKISLNVGGNI